MIDQAFAERFAAEWIEAWNSHDLDRILSHYADDFEMASPYIARLAGEASGRLRGKAAVGAYWAEALRLIPDLRFERVEVLAGVDSLVLYYRSIRGRAAEVFFFGVDGKVVRACAHYTGE
jgi:ketosteroid isomerase-like protein